MGTVKDFQKFADELMSNLKGAEGIQAQKDTELSSIQELLDKISNQRTGLVSELEASGKEMLGNVKTQREKRLADLSNLLAGREERLFSEASPQILESLSSRGLLHSSGVGQELAQEKSKLASQSQEALGAQSLADVDYEQKLAEDIQNKIFGLKTGALTDTSTYGNLGLGSISELGRAGLERQFSLDDRNYAAELAKTIAELNKKAQDQSSLFGLAGTVGGLFLGGPTGAAVGGSIGNSIGNSI